MVGKNTRRRDRVDWEILARQYEAGMSTELLASKTGLSASWIIHGVARCRKDDARTRASYYRQAIHRELVRAEADLVSQDVDQAMKKFRALVLLIKLEESLQPVSSQSACPSDDASGHEDVKAELETRFERLRALGEHRRALEILDGLAADTASL